MYVNACAARISSSLHDTQSDGHKTSVYEVCSHVLVVARGCQAGNSCMYGLEPKSKHLRDKCNHMHKIIGPYASNVEYAHPHCGTLVGILC